MSKNVWGYERGLDDMPDDVAQGLLDRAVDALRRRLIVWPIAEVAIRQADGCRIVTATIWDDEGLPIIRMNGRTNSTDVLVQILEVNGDVVASETASVGIQYTDAVALSVGRMLRCRRPTR